VLPAVLPAVLERMVGAFGPAFGVRAALAFQPGGGPGMPAVLAAHPREAVDAALLARIGALSVAQRDAAGDAPVELAVHGGPGAASALVAYSTPVGGQCLCALALIGDAPAWDEEIRACAHAVAAIVATQIRHANAVARLAQRQALTRALIDGSPIAALAFDAEGRLIEFNPAAEKLSGYRRDDVLGREMAEFLVPERDRTRVRQHISIYVQTGDPGEFIGQMRINALRADGSERTVELTPVQITLGGQAVFTGFLRDLTEIERSHAALADQTERLNCLINTAIPGVLITDEQGQITHVSQSFGAMFGIDEPTLLVGTSAVSIVRRIRPVFADPRRFTRRAVEVFRARQPMSGEQIPCADGRTVECDYWPILVDDRYRGDLWLTWDMTDRKELERQRMQALEAELAARQLAEQAQRQLAEQNERLRRLDDARNQFLAIVSHELRTPLTSIVSFSELIRGEAEGLTPEGVRFLDIIERNADRLHRLIGDLLMMDRLEAGALPLDLAAVSVSGLVTEAVRIAAPGAARQGVTLEVRAGRGPAVQGDARRLMQVLDNLISNAVKFSHRDGLVLITAACRRRTWRIDVADSGIGIPAEEADQLFSRFVRASNARTAGLPGTGLGLSIVKVLVEMHGGRVSVRSTLGQGSTFSVFLPAPGGAE
ncbi:MAG TPA: PAS domain S-box protein, partial [Streptosporangiaceae bacterium]|nr:PAS domain S-box protein [Streptosporangiaceae bacterium]